MPPVVMQLINVLSWLAIPVGLVCVIDDWLLKPHRQFAAAPAHVSSAVLWCYRLLPVLLVAVVLRIFAAEAPNFSAGRAILAGLTGYVGLVARGVVAGLRAVSARRSRW